MWQWDLYDFKGIPIAEHRLITDVNKVNFTVPQNIR